MVKVYNPIVSDAAQLLRGATQAFGATRARLLSENLGDYAPPEVLSERPADAAVREAKYQRALENGHEVIVLIAEVWGGFTPEAMSYLGELAHADLEGIMPHFRRSRLHRCRRKRMKRSRELADQTVPKARERCRHHAFSKPAR